jgi:hypothetical protein
LILQPDKLRQSRSQFEGMKLPEPVTDAYSLILQQEKQRNERGFDSMQREKLRKLQLTEEEEEGVAERTEEIDRYVLLTF